LLTSIFTRDRFQGAAARQYTECHRQEECVQDESPDEDDASLFRRAMRGVRPLVAEPRAHAARRHRAPRAHFARAERQAVLDESLGPPSGGEVQPGDELLFRRPGVPETVLRRLRQGVFRVEGVLDLHGLNASDGARQLREFLRYARARELRCVRIIHGKGLRSGTRGPVLKQAVNTLLRQADLVLAFASARPRDGGTGATLVLLRRPQAAR
jgi:DNA-nicking Smr family endonuclease